MESWIGTIIIIISYSMLILQFYKASRKGYNSTTDVVMKGGDLSILNQRHLISLVAMAVAIVYFNFKNQDWLLLHIPNKNAIVLSIIIAAIALLISLRTARKALQNETLNIQNVGSAEMYLWLRGLFLVVYEVFFRAILLNFCLAFTTVPIAIGINVVLYAIAHAFSTKQELVGTIPFGIPILFGRLLSFTCCLVCRMTSPRCL